MNEKEKTETKNDFERAIKERKNQKYVLRLYVAGSTSNSLVTIENIQNIAKEYLEGRYELEVIDIYQQPDRIKNDQIIVTPTLIKRLPMPFRKIIGNLSNKERVLVGLELWKKK
jgi:circadian clock protein KaiB